MCLDQIVNRRCIIRNLRDLTHDLKQLAKILFRRIKDLDLIRNSPQERVVYEIFGFKLVLKITN